MTLMAVDCFQLLLLVSEEGEEEVAKGEDRLATQRNSFHRPILDVARQERRHASYMTS